MRSGIQSVHDARPREVHRSTTMLTLMVFLWGTISLGVVPWEPFWFPNFAQSIACAVLLGYLMWTWRQPRLRVVEGISAILIVYTLLIVPWSTVAWCRLGSPLDAFAVPEAALVSVALVYRGPAWICLGAMSLFAAETLFIYAYAHHLGMDALVPINGTTGTVGVFGVGVGIVVVRRRRHELVRNQVRCLAEIEALERVRPLFAHARDELETQVGLVAAEVCSSDARAPSAGMRRALDRLGALHDRIGSVVAGDESGRSQLDAERRLRDHEAQLGAMFLAAVGVAMNAMASLTLHLQLGDVPWPILAKLVFDGGFVLFLAGTQRRPSSRRALWAVIACYVTALATATYAESWLVHGQLPYTPFLGHKALMCIIGLTLGTRFKLGAVLIVATLAQAIVLWFVLDLRPDRGMVPLSEPWATLIYTSIALVSLRMVARGQAASVELQRAEAEAVAMRRRARLLLALRDRLNTPLQTLLLGADYDIFQLSPRSNERVHGAIDRLVHLSRELAGIDVELPPEATVFDADQELRRQS